VTGMGIDVDGALASTHLMFVKRGLQICVANISNEVGSVKNVSS